MRTAGTRLYCPVCGVITFSRENCLTMCACTGEGIIMLDCLLFDCGGYQLRVVPS